MTKSVLFGAVLALTVTAMRCQAAEILLFHYWVEINGDLELGDAKNFEAKMDGANFMSVDLNSNGGRIVEAIAW